MKAQLFVLVSVLLKVFVLVCVLESCHAHSVLYVAPNTTASCVGEPCNTLSEYAEDLGSYLDSNSTLIFMPGTHTLMVNFLLFEDICPNCSSVHLAALQPGESTTIECQPNTRIYFSELSFLRISGLVFSYCGNPPFNSLTVQFVTFTEVEDCTFLDNIDAITVQQGSFLAKGNSFIGTSSGRIAGAVLLVRANATFTDNDFRGNFASESSGGINALVSHVTLSGINTFDENRGYLGGAIAAFGSTVTVLGSTAFTSNSVGGGLGGAVFATLRSNVSFLLRPVFSRNSAQLGGAISVLNGQVEFASGVSFVSNSAEYGGALYSVASTIILYKNSSIVKNVAVSGGAVFLASNTILLLAPNSSLFFSNNSAQVRGGAIYVQDFNPLIYCFSRAVVTYANQNCFFQIVGLDGPVEDAGSHLFFEGNFAEEAGNVLFGGAIDSCTIIDGSTPSAIPEAFDSLAVVVSANATERGDFSNKDISSEPFNVCPCSKENEIMCDVLSLHREVFSGGTFTISAVGIGQRLGVVSSVIQVYNSTVNIGDLELTKTIPSRCTELTYTVFATPGNATVELFAEGPCFTTGIPLTIQLQVLHCPPGLTQAEPNGSCVCDERLERFTNVCNASDGTILRDGDFWVGYDSESQGLILHPNCPFEYCISSPVSFKVEDSNVQCNHNRMGLLCGSCPNELSLLLGSSQCDRCSNGYLGLLLFFILAGLLLVAFLLICKLTVAIGSINGLVFYANVVAANRATFFPQQSNGYVDFLNVFIAWINLDFGIETCFYDGMDAYAKTWLQFVFPIYIWGIIGLLILIGKFVPRLSRLFGTNPVAVLATLVLLSYAKLLRTIIAAFSSATLDYPEGSELVWLYDGNIRFFRGKHTPLFVISLLFLLLDFVPYTALLLASHWLQAWSDWKILSWLNNLKLKTFLDTYHAPYKPKHRYWTGLLLLVRFAILLTSALNSKVDPSINLIVIGILLLFLFVLTWNFGGIYKKWYNEALESFFLVNLGLLTVSTFHVQLESAQSGLSSNETNRQQVAVVSILITAALIVFIGIVSVHVYNQLRCSGVPAAIQERLGKQRNFEMSEPSLEALHYVKDALPTNDSSAPTQTFVDLREELLEDTA